jgi:hypothetical protein
VVLVIGVSQAMSSEVDEEPIGRRLEGRDFVGQTVGEGGEAGLRIEEANHLETLSLQGAGNGIGVADGVVEGRNTVAVGVDADDDGEAALKAG